MAPITETQITCPTCKSRTPVSMPTNACVQAWDCPACAARLRPARGDCCVFCTYADDRCPPEQAAT